MNPSIRAARPLLLGAASSSFLVALSCAAAADAPFELQPVSVTASRTPRTLGSSIAATSVLTRGDIERSGARDAVAVLSLLGSALVEQQGGPGTAAVVRIRGADSRDTLVLVDGVPLTDVTSGQASLSQLPAEWIERIEVVRGNLSALYGANATGGVIQIFTRRGVSGAPRIEVDAGAGSRGTRSLQTSISGGNEAVRARFSAGMERSTGFSAADPASAPQANPDTDGYLRHHAALAVDAEVAPGHRLGLDLRYITGTVDYDSTSSFSAPTDTHVNHSLQSGVTLRAEHRIAPRWTLGWHVAESRERRTDTTLGSFGPFTSSNRLRNQDAVLELSAEPAAGWRLQLGAERLRQSTDSASYIESSRRTDTWRIGSTYDAAWGGLQANLRRDRTSDFGSATTGLVGARFVLGHGFSAIASAGTSFTPPTLDFLFFDCSPFVCSNPALRPERARNVDAGLQWEGADSLLRATAFAARYRDKIANDADFVPQNTARVKNSGVELSARTRVDAWMLVAEGAVQDPLDESTGRRPIRRARTQATLRADYVAPAWSAGTAIRYVGDRLDQVGGGIVTLPSYSVVDASARWAVNPQWALQMRVDNLFGRRYAPVAGYNGRPRGAFFGASWQPRH
jgi:vitamin B12 transporter